MGNAIANVTRQSYDLGGGVRGGVDPSPAVGAWKGNEPLGMTSLPELTFDNGTVAADGWIDHSSASGNFSIVTDATNPYTSSNVGRARYPSGGSGGGAFVNVGCLTAPSAGAQELYHCFGLKLSSNFQNHVTGTNKLFFGNVEGYSGGGDPYFINIDSDFSPRRVLPVLQGPLGRIFNAYDTTPIELDTWVLIESQLIMNTAGNSDGVLRQWHDGVLAIEALDVEFVNAIYEWTSTPIWQPTWGGGGDTVVDTFYHYMAGIYTSWKL